MPRIKAVTFDLWETLIADSRVQDDLRTEYRVSQTAQLLLAAGAAVDLGDLYAAHEEVWRRCELQWRGNADLPFAEQAALFLDLVRPGLAASLPAAVRQRAAAVYGEAVLHYPPQLVPGVAETLAALKRKRLKLGLICNTGRSPGAALRRLLESFGIFKRFNVALFSDETAVRKPDPAIFRQALAALAVQPAAAVHVGDNAAADVGGAMAAGMQAVWVRREAEAQPECLAAIGSVAELPEVLKSLEG
ncbi:MAG: HAD family hydrolase [Candidatus Edwardsbacteria bacterium]|jgi:putative hydrolase of the HAD superfamily|nr:HAD family hydrolase [Candidatus Edwardsbacteria bacterium]